MVIYIVFYILYVDCAYANPNFLIYPPMALSPLIAIYLLSMSIGLFYFVNKLIHMTFFRFHI